MNSGRIMERRDQVLIGFLSLVVTALSALATRWWSTNGPFLRERVICYPLLLATRHDHDLGALVVAGTVTLGQVAPRIDGVTAFAGLALATAVRVVDRVHHHTANGRANTHVALHAGLAQLAQAVLFVGDFADGGAALDVDLADLTGAHADLGVGAFASQQRRGGAGRAGDLRALARLQFDAMDRRADRDVAHRQGVAGTDRGLGAGQQRCADFQAARGDDVAALAVGVAHQCDVSRAVRVVLDALHLGRDAVLVADEVDNTVVMLVATALVTGRDVAIVVATGLLELRLQQRRERIALVQVITRDLHH